MQVELQGQQQLFNTLNALERQIVYKDAQNGLKRAGMQIIADAQRNLRNSHINTTSRLSNSGKVQEAADGQGLDVGFMSGDENYAGAVEYGIKNPKWFSYKALWNWVSKKHNLKLTKHTGKNGRPLKDDVNPEVKTIAYFVRNKIVRQGTEPHPFFKPAVEKNETRILQEITKAIKRTINRNGV